MRVSNNFTFFRQWVVSLIFGMKRRPALNHLEPAQDATQAKYCVFSLRQVLFMEIVTQYSLDKAVVTIQGTIGDNARYFLLSDGQGKTAKTQIARGSESKSLLHIII